MKKKLYVLNKLITLLKGNITDSNPTEREFRATVLFRFFLIIVIYFVVDVRENIPDWMYLAFKNAAYPLFIYNGLLFIFYKKINKVLSKIPVLIFIDLFISVGLMLIGAGWRNSYFGYTLTTIILFTIFLKIKGAWFSTIMLILVSLIKEPSAEGIDMLSFSVSNMDMRLGAASAYIVAGVIIGYFRYLLDKIRQLSRERIAETRKAAVMEQKMKLALDLHDNIKSKINAIVLLYNPLLKRLFKKHSEDQEDLLRLWKWLYYLQTETMRFFISLKSEHHIENTSFELMALIRDEISLFSEITRFSWSFESEVGNLFLPIKLKQSLLQFIGESMLNAWKHSGVKQGVIKLEKQAESSVSLSIAENGKGFILTDDLLTSYSGIHSLHIRAEEVKGRLKIEAAPGAGCRLTLSIPVYED
ncbi:MAG: hypothetical protein JW822_09140 [Spirochaetales bacterium]|nr:hypothetical protein [Spirochaetales bacterium]